MHKDQPLHPFQHDYLSDYTHINPILLELTEYTSMLQVIEYGMKVCIVATVYDTKTVDTLEYLRKV